MYKFTAVFISDTYIIHVSRNKYTVFIATQCSLTFKNLAFYTKDGRTATLQMLHFIYIYFQQL
jgi:hypothetical protein